MTKHEFLAALRGRLSGLPEEDLERSLEYYSESIDDRMEDGLTEEEAVGAMGSIDEIVSQILMGTPRPKPAAQPAENRPKPDRTGKIWLIALLVLGFPLWFPLLTAFVSILFAAYVVLWSMILVFYAVDLSFAAGALSGIFGFFVSSLTGSAVTGVFLLGFGLVCTGLTILWFFGCALAAKGVVWLTKKLFQGIKGCFSGRRNAS